MARSVFAAGEAKRGGRQTREKKGQKRVREESEEKGRQKRAGREEPVPQHSHRWSDEMWMRDLTQWHQQSCTAEIQMEKLISGRKKHQYSETPSYSLASPAAVAIGQSAPALWGSLLR